MSLILAPVVDDGAATPVSSASRVRVFPDEVSSLRLRIVTSDVRIARYDVETLLV
jgi:hypothetical protein